MDSNNIVTFTFQRDKTVYIKKESVLCDDENKMSTCEMIKTPADVPKKIQNFFVSDEEVDITSADAVCGDLSMVDMICVEKRFDLHDIFNKRLHTRTVKNDKFGKKNIRIL